jgi:hypothetical protein
MEPVRVLAPLVIGGLVIGTWRLRTMRRVCGTLFLVCSLFLGSLGVARWSQLDAFEKQVALGLNAPDARSWEAYFAQARARDAGVPIMLATAGASVGLLLISLSVDPHATSKSRSGGGRSTRRQASGHSPASDRI